MARRSTSSTLRSAGGCPEPDGEPGHVGSVSSETATPKRLAYARQQLHQFLPGELERDGGKGLWRATGSNSCRLTSTWSARRPPALRRSSCGTTSSTSCARRLAEPAPVGVSVATLADGRPSPHDGSHHQPRAAGAMRRPSSGEHETERRLRSKPVNELIGKSIPSQPAHTLVHSISIRRDGGATRIAALRARTVEDRSKKHPGPKATPQLLRGHAGRRSRSRALPPEPGPSSRHSLNCTRGGVQ